MSTKHHAARDEASTAVPEHAPCGACLGLLHWRHEPGFPACAACLCHDGLLVVLTVSNDGITLSAGRAAMCVFRDAEGHGCVSILLQCRQECSRS